MRHRAVASTIAARQSCFVPGWFPSLLGAQESSPSAEGVLDPY